MSFVILLGIKSCLGIQKGNWTFTVFEGTSKQPTCGCLPRHELFENLIAQDLEQRKLPFVGRILSEQRRFYDQVYEHPWAIVGKSWQWFILAYTTALGMLLVAKGIQNWIPLVFQIPQLKEGLVKHSQALFLANRTPAVPFFLYQNIRKKSLQATLAYST